jgi:hypothetical protein
MGRFYTLYKLTILNVHSMMKTPYVLSCSRLSGVCTCYIRSLFDKSMTLWQRINGFSFGLLRS